MSCYRQMYVCGDCPFLNRRIKLDIDLQCGAGKLTRYLVHLTGRRWDQHNRFCLGDTWSVCKDS